ncbi:MAG TPA: hypothetical protein PKY50_03285, partial [Candidatus Competibacter sp.]|nr:hypothetical protein [Candidatus Competibacter sp.]
MKNKILLIALSALVTPVPAVVFARGPADDLPFKMMEQVFQGTPFDGVIENIPRKDRDRSKGGRDYGRDRSGGRDHLGDDDAGRGRNRGDDDAGRGRNRGDDDAGR